MRDHALPQDVTGYRFHIIGNMTLKQFAEVAAGCVVAFLIYSTNLYPIIKFPLVFIVAGLGAFTAFVPIEERPFDHWIIAFINALYRPTLFYWKRTPKIPDAFLYTSKTQVSIVQEVDLTPARRQRVKEYLRSIDEVPIKDQMDLYTDQRLSDVMSVFDQVNHGVRFSQTAATVTMTKMPAQLPQAQVVEKELPIVTVSESKPEPQSAPTSTTEAAQLISMDQAKADISINIKQTQQQQAPSSDQLEVMALPTMSDVDVKTQVHPQRNFSSEPTSGTMGGGFSSSVSKPVSVPQMQTLTIEHSFQKDTTTGTIATQQPIDTQTFVDAGSSGTTTIAPSASGAVVQNKQLPFPQKPTEPNKLVGMVVDASNNSLPGTIVEVLNEEGMAARAVKTNLLGQFFITTPLNNGRYFIRAEREGSEFPVKELVVNGQIIDPIEVRSTL